MKHQELTDKIIGCFYAVYNGLGYGFLESIYQRALIIELAASGLRVDSQYPIWVFYGEHRIGEFWADIVVEDLIVLELKAAKTLLREHEAQLLSYLNASQFEVGLVFNFGPVPQMKRKILDNHRKRYKGSQIPRTAHSDPRNSDPCDPQDP